MEAHKVISLGVDVLSYVILSLQVRNMKTSIMQELQEALSHQAPKQGRDNPNQFELPPLVIEGIPTPVDKMTQAQLRAFIPLMLKYSTGRGKPGWGKESCRPVWWPSDLPWANVRSDVRSEDDKRKVTVYNSSWEGKEGFVTNR